MTDAPKTSNANVDVPPPPPDPIPGLGRPETLGLFQFRRLFGRGRKTARTSSYGSDGTRTRDLRRDRPAL
jgi:hypothetical protein